MIKHFKTIEDTLDYLKLNPTFVSGFTSGEGCFTAYLGIDTSLT
jgi:tripartite-type tricarboxylate transporter receptor subunit TctC